MKKTHKPQRVRDRERLRDLRKSKRKSDGQIEIELEKE